jgi:hypothetical protein
MLVACALLLGSAGLRAAARQGADGLDRVIAAAPLAAATAVAEALGLGLFSLGTDPLALGITSLLVWMALRLLLADPDEPLARSFADWWGGLGTARAAGLGAAVALGLAWAIWLQMNPTIGFDGIQYHLSEVAAWVQSGRPGAIVPISYELPFGNYPLTNEVLLAWLGGISHGLAAPMLWAPLMLGLLATSAWAGLRRLDVDRRVAVLGVLALVTVPVVVEQLPKPGTDLAAAAWLACAGALTLAARRRPGLLAPAVVAIGLSLGSKTSVALFAVGLFAACIWIARDAGRPAWRALALGLLGALVAGGAWYLRNWITHGSPLWPFVPGPWGDPVPEFVSLFRNSFLSDPAGTLAGREAAYATALGGGLLLVAGAIVSPLAERRRAVLVSAAVTVAGLLVWAAAPVTGRAEGGLFPQATISTVRYLLPVLGAAVVTLAWAAQGRRTRSAVTVLLGIAVLVNAVVLWPPGTALVPPWYALIVAVVAGALFGLALGATLPVFRAGGRVVGAIALAGVALTLALVGTASSWGFTARHASTGSGFDIPVLRAITSQPGYAGGAAPVAMGRTLMATLAGDDFSHPIVLIPADEPCERTIARTRAGWVVINDREFSPALKPFAAAGCLAEMKPWYDDGSFRIYGGPAG